MVLNALKTDIESVLLPTDRAIPIGLIVNELMTNAVKYAFPGKSSGTVTVVLTRVPGELRLTVADDGKGVDPVRANSGLGGRPRASPNSSTAGSSGRPAARLRPCA